MRVDGWRATLGLNAGVHMRVSVEPTAVKGVPRFLVTSDTRKRQLLSYDVCETTTGAWWGLLPSSDAGYMYTWYIYWQ